MRSNQKGFGAVEAILILVIIGILGLAGWWVYKSTRTTNEPLDDPQDSAGNSENTAKNNESAKADDEYCSVPEGFTAYADVVAGFCFAYPGAWGEVSLREGIIDAAAENGEGYVGTFSQNPDASFAYRSSDWAFTGPGRGGPSHATGFNELLSFEISGSGTEVIKRNTEDEQLVAYNSMMDYTGVIISAKKRFIRSAYPGVEISYKVPASGEFDPESSSPDDLVSGAQYETMAAILDSVTEI